jgi:hypothetical protein
MMKSKGITKIMSLQPMAPREYHVAFGDMLRYIGPKKPKKMVSMIIGTQGILSALTSEPTAIHLQL